MNNPWEKIDLSTYETHMSSDGLYQLQTLKSITEEQIENYVHTNVLILGVAGGNGLEHIDISSTEKVFGLDINSQYLDMCKERYPHLTGILELVCCDLNNSDVLLPYSNIMICNLIIEYIGVNKFIELISNNKDNVNVISCVIQKNNNNDFVSNSKLTSSLELLISIHHDIDSENLFNKFLKIGFVCIKKNSYLLPNGKELIRMDFGKV
ncbi:hypothetical protein [Desulfitobacterium metallireducens]|uniref:Methyltransferase type 11 n=1 Tax=Desulfitobacterium metallireducens DSM 15288 TaxID=871968 RepID=W0E9E6_9FIRM|nr:hypothetical protein [Desulfitobacterium metallireducens]AHF07387.1 methyltransferase type 11 [Desulfitobacterium metallireducens DSM 15288]